MTVMRAVHKAVRRVHATSPWWSENTVRTVYILSHDLPCPRHAAVGKVVHWFTANAIWCGSMYTNWVIPAEFQPEGYTSAWCEDITLPRNIAAET